MLARGDRRGQAPGWAATERYGAGTLAVLVDSDTGTV